jgi:diguanylate cyclase (GGDEF)-like protein
MFDIDGFKDINDIHGHDVGDSVLKELSRLVSSHIRSDDIFARWGGEEFMIIVNVDVVIAEQFANKLRQIIEDHTFKHIDTLTCSFGVTRYKEGDKTEQILKRADTMLYSAKKSGKNCVVAFS